MDAPPATVGGGAAAVPLRWLWLVALGSVGWLLVLAARTPVPSEDGVSYLWMAQQFAGGAWRKALSMVFPPGFPLLCAPCVALGLPAEAVGIGCGVLCTAAALWPVARIAERLLPGAGLGAAVLFATSPLLGRVAVEVYSEPPFLLAVAWGTWFGLCGQWWRLGLCAGLAFWIRPEGLLLAASFVLVAPRAAWRALLPAALGVLLLAALRWLAGHGFDPLPILVFHEQRTDLPGRGDVLANLIAVPGAWIEAFGVAAVLMLLAALRRWRPPGTGVLWWQIALQIATVCTFVVRRRFLLSAAVPAIVLGGVALVQVPWKLRRGVLLACAVAGVVFAFLGTIDPDRIAERRLGEHLASRLASGRTVTGDLTRVLWFAGQRPLPPRHFDSTQLEEMAAAIDVQFVVISERSVRAPTVGVYQFPDYAPLALPVRLDALCTARGIAVYVRR